MASNVTGAVAWRRLLPRRIDRLIARAAALEPRWAAAGVPAALDALQNGVDIPALVFDGTEIPRLDPTRRLVPITDLDELIDLFARVIEDQAPPMISNVCWTCLATL